ncbi:MAG: stress responsive alpha-beta barrel domain-containing protein [Syntrophus sp. (in: bacteria)]|nr:stress responsive alpha-beta barrel domain-containing protein [Syntrophus sp. (in: bacteria)]
MLKHIVFMKFKPDVTASDIDQLKQALGGLPALIPEIREFVFGQDILRTERSWDFGLVSTFENVEALNRYQVHADHQVVVQKVRAMCDSIVVVDFEF